MRGTHQREGPEGLKAQQTSQWVFGKPDLTMALNGVLAGLVGITAGADLMAMGSAIAIGGVAGVIVVFSVILFDRIRIDDPVGAISVHLVCGVWGTLAVGIFSPEHSIGIQLIGIVAYGVGAFVPCLLIFASIRATLGLRVAADEELEGLDLAEHGMHAYDLPLAGSGFADGRALPPGPEPSPNPLPLLAESEGA